jgi:hypothetical protein
MSDTYKQIATLVKKGNILISNHGYDEMANDGILARDIIFDIENAVLVEDYPDYIKGPCVLLLQKDHDKRPMHVVWGIPKGHSSPAVIVTAYRPDPSQWIDDYTRRRK